MTTDDGARPDGEAGLDPDAATDPPADDDSPSIEERLPEPTEDLTPADMKKTLRRDAPQEVEEARQKIVEALAGSEVLEAIQGAHTAADDDTAEPGPSTSPGLAPRPPSVPPRVPLPRMPPSKPPPAPAPEGGRSRRPLPPPRSLRPDGTEQSPEPPPVGGSELDPPTVQIDRDSAEAIDDGDFLEVAAAAGAAGPNETEPVAGPPGIPSLAPSRRGAKEDPAKAQARPSSAGRRKKGSRRRHRRTLKIPDDEVPATPAPPAVESAPTTAADQDESDEAGDEGRERTSRDTLVMADGAEPPPDEGTSATSESAEPAVEAPAATGAAEAEPGQAAPGSAEPSPPANADGALAAEATVEPANPLTAAEAKTREIPVYTGPPPPAPVATNGAPEIAAQDLGADGAAVEATALEFEELAPEELESEPGSSELGGEADGAAATEELTDVEPEPITVKPAPDEAEQLSDAAAPPAAHGEPTAPAPVGPVPPDYQPFPPPAPSAEPPPPAAPDVDRANAQPAAAQPPPAADPQPEPSPTQPADATDAPSEADDAESEDRVTLEPEPEPALEERDLDGAPPGPTLPDGEAPTDPAPADPADQASATADAAPMGVVTDRTSVGIIMPIQVSSDLPAVEGKPKKARPVPPRRRDRPAPTEEELEEIEPELVGPGDLEPLGEAGAPPAPGAASMPPAGATPSPPPAATTPSPPPAGGATPSTEPAAEAAEPKAPKPKAPKRKKSWWVDLFEEDFLRTFDAPKPSDVEREVRFIERSLRLERGARILDLGCGMGRHAVELSTRGYEVVGVDLSPTMVSKAADHAVDRGQRVNFVKGDMRKLALESVFDGIYCWSATFGYFDEQTNAAVIESIHRALRPGGTLALDVANRDFIAPRSPTMVWFQQPGCVCMDEMKFDFFTSRMIVKRMVLFETGKSREVEYSIRLYGLHELGRLLHQAGFKVLEVSGHRAHAGAFFGSESPRIMIAAERI